MTNLPPQPAGYGPTDAAEREAVSLFYSLLDLSLVKPDLKVCDKNPNSDGFLELVGSDGFPIGKLEVQVKKIPDGNLKYQCPRELFVYSERTTLPFILVCVDTGNKKVYWQHIRKEEFPFSTGQASVKIDFDPAYSQITPDKKYYSQWRTIIGDYSERVQKYHLLRSLSANIAALPPSRSSEVGKIQEFLDELNGLLDGDYSCVKRVKFPAVWKIGFGLSSWTTDTITYWLYSIDKGENKPMISSAVTSGDMSFPDHGFYGHYGPNELVAAPKAAARGYIYESLKEMIKHQALSIRQPLLCREYLFSYIDSHLYCLGLKQSDLYTIDEIKRAFYDYLPRWCDIGIKSLTFYPSHLGHADPGIIRMMLAKDISKTVEEAIQKKQPISAMTIGSSRFSYRLLFDLLDYSRINGVQKIERVYRLGTVHTGSMIWDRYSEDEARYNFNLVYQNFDEAYREFLEINGLKDPALQLFSEHKGLVCQYVHSAGKPMRDYPSVKTYKITFPPGWAGKRILVVSPDDKTFHFDNPDDGNWSLKLGIDTLPVHETSGGMGDYLFHDNPLLNLIYRKLLDKIEAGLKTLKKS